MIDDPDPVSLLQAGKASIIVCWLTAGCLSGQWVAGR